MFCNECGSREGDNRPEQGDVEALAAAIEIGDLAGARKALDLVFRGDDRLTDWIERGRRSRAVRMARCGTAANHTTSIAAAPGYQGDRT